MEKYFLHFILLLILLKPSIIFSQGCYSDQSDLYWKISESLYGSKRLSDCHALAYYNCHGFATSYFENGCTAPSWTSGQIPAPYTCPNAKGVTSASAFRSSGKYVQVCSEVTANIAYYQFIQGDHSAVKESLGNGVIKYLSNMVVMVLWLHII